MFGQKAQPASASSTAASASTCATAPCSAAVAASCWSCRPPGPLRVHGHDSRAEIEAAYCYAEACGYGVLTDHAPWIHREGALWHEPSQCDLLFVTRKKSEALFSPSHPLPRPGPSRAMRASGRWRFAAAGAGDPGDVDARLLLGTAAGLAV